jgi:hypothetical protein
LPFISLSLARTSTPLLHCTFYKAFHALLVLILKILVCKTTFLVTLSTCLFAYTDSAIILIIFFLVFSLSVSN